MDRKKVYLHIGYHKTGTTSIQFALSRNRDALLEHGYLYPTSGEKWNAHHNLAWQLQETNRYDRFDPELGSWDDLIAEIYSSPAPNVILSSEDFCNSKPATIATYAEKLRPFDVQVVVYLRRQDLYLQSKWVQIAKLGMPLPEFPKWLETELKNNQLLNYAVSLDAWTKEFGRENIRVRPFEKEVLGTGLIGDFLRTCDLEDFSWFERTKSQNISPSVQVMSLVREISRGVPNLTGVQVTTPEFKNLLAYIRNYYDLHNENHQKINLLSKKIYKQIMSGFKKTNRQVARTFLGRDELFLEPFNDQPLSVFDASQLKNDELLRLLVETFKKTIENMDQGGEVAKPDVPAPSTQHQNSEKIEDTRVVEPTEEVEIEYEVVVYQMGKVASTSIVESLNAVPTVQAHQSHFLGVENLQKILALSLNLDLNPYFLKHQKGQIMMNIDLTRLVKGHIEGLIQQPQLGVVSLTREPIDWFRSQMIQQLPAYLDGFATLCGLEDKEQLTESHILLALDKLKDNFKETIRTIGQPIDRGFMASYQREYIHRLREENPFAEIFFTHFRQFMRPFLWYPTMVTSVLDISPDELVLNNEGFQLIERDWGFFYLFRYEDLAIGFERLVRRLGLEMVPLSQENISSSKQFSDEIKQAFMQWKNDEELKNLIRCDYTQRFGYH